METYLSAIVASAVVVIGVVGFLGVVLVMRNPHNPAWVLNEAFAQAVCLLMTFGLVSMMAVAVNGFFRAGLGVIESFGVAGGIAIVAGTAFWLLVRFGERIRRADQGRSTLERIGHDFPHSGANVGAA